MATRTEANAQMAGIMQATHVVPEQRWHARGYLISIASSLLMALAIGVFFIAMPGWSPADTWRSDADFAVTWIMLTYIWVQLGSLILVGAGTITKRLQQWAEPGPIGVSHGVDGIS